MSFDPGTAGRIRALLSGRDDVTETRVVGGGLGFLVGRHLCCALSERGLSVRVGPEAKAEALSHETVRPLTLGRRETAAFVVVARAGYQAAGDLEAWVERGLRFVATLDQRPRPDRRARCEQGRAGHG